MKFKNPIKKEFIIILIGIIISFTIASKNLEKFDKIVNNSSGEPKHMMLTSDMRYVWKLAEKFRFHLSNGKSFFEALPIYDRAFLQPILVGYYYHIIDKKIIEKNDKGQIIIKTQNSKLGILVIQILIYYLSVYFFIIQFSKRFNQNNDYINLILLSFLCFEPTILQWVSSFWSESLFLSMLLILFGSIINPTKSKILKLLSGILLGLIYALKAISFFYIFPIILFFLFVYKKKIFSTLIFVLGFILITSLIGFNHYQKTGTFYVMSSKHSYYSYYYYFASKLYADRNDISRIKAKNEINDLEIKWRNENNVEIYSPINNENKTTDLMKNIQYRNKFFLNEVYENPLYFIKLYFKGIAAMSILSPTMVYEGYEIDKSSPEAKNNPKEYFNKNLNRNIFYSLIIYCFVLIGFKNFVLRVVKGKKIVFYDKFLILNILSILYFVSIAGLWGYPRYFTPCLINISFFFANGLNDFLIKFKK